MGKMRRLAISVTVTLFSLLAAVVASGEQMQEGNLRVSFDGRIAPHALPRAKPVPVTVHLKSSVGTVDGSRPPQLRKVSIAVNQTGHLSLTGLPVCPRGRLQQTSTAAALVLCRGALVGHGVFDAVVEFASGPPIPVHGKVVVFNSRIGDRAALLLHIYNSSPVRLAFVIPFTISRHPGDDFGTVFAARIPRIASDRGYVTALGLTLRRRYAFNGKRRSIFSASCAAPPGYPGAIFTLARATFTFENGKRLTSALIRDCAVR
jgi:hypothetical protein